MVQIGSGSKRQFNWVTARKKITQKPGKIRPINHRNSDHFPDVRKMVYIININNLQNQTFKIQKLITWQSAQNHPK